MTVYVSREEFLAARVIDLQDEMERLYAVQKMLTETISELTANRDVAAGLSLHPAQMEVSA
jgi:hypothetical protein